MTVSERFFLFLKSGPGSADLCPHQETAAMKNWLGVIGGLEGGGSGQQPGQPKKAASGLTVGLKRDLFIIAFGPGL